ncbi:MAG: hypothetical protein ACOCWH_05610, partial [Spirochaetota bacterium]
MSTPLDTILNEYPFLDKASAREPYIFDVLNEIRSIQKKVEKGQAKEFATRSQLYKSHAIKMPFSPSRDKNISYLLEHLTDRFPEYVSSIITFQVSVNEKNKKLVIDESEEYVYNLTVEEVDRLQSIRDDKSLESIVGLIGRFRIFNISKLMKMVNNKKQLNRVLQKAVNKDIFIYKHVEIVQNKAMPTQELCFHRKNYEAVKQSLNIQELKGVIASYRDMILPRLSHYGIPNTDITEYKETKVDYLLHIILDDLKSTLSPRDRIAAENFKSLRECIIKVDQALDPKKIYHNDILKTIKSAKMATASDIAVTLMSVDETTVKSWAQPDVLKKEHIITQKSANNQFYFIFGPSLLHEFKKRYGLIRYDPEKYQEMSTTEKDRFKMHIETLIEAANHALAQNRPEEVLGISKDDAEALGELIEEYQSWIKQKQLRNELTSSDLKKGSRPSILGSIIDAIKSLFSLFSADDEDEELSSSRSLHHTSTSSAYATASYGESSSRPRPMTKDSKNVYAKLMNRKAPILALSDFVQLSKENDSQVDQIIKDLRDNNIKIIMPVYNARKALYPKRSSKLLIP